MVTRKEFCSSLLPNNLNQNSFSSHSVEFPIEDLFPGAEIKPTVRNGHNYFAPHDLSFQMGIGIVFVAVVPVLAVRLFGGKALQPLFKVGMQSTFIVVYKYTGRNVHGVAEEQSLLDAGFDEACFHLGRNIHVIAAVRCFEVEFFAV